VKGLTDIMKSYWECLQDCLQDISRKCRKSVVEDLVDVISGASGGWGACLGPCRGDGDKVDEKCWRRYADALPLSLVVVRARLVYRGRPGSGVPLPPVELGLLVHPVFLVPFFPGSAVKGLLRSVYKLLLGEKGLDSDAVERCVEGLFGSTEGLRGVGALVAFDAYPVEPGRGGVYAVGDVLAPHYGPGGDRELVTELDAVPRPVQGVSVAEGTVFEFAVGVDEDYAAARLSRDCLLGSPGTAILAARLLALGLEHAGLGGKTTRGYGLFEVKEARLFPQTRTRRVKS